VQLYDVQLGSSSTNGQAEIQPQQVGVQDKRVVVGGVEE
jgi:hypothetical protein